jgi:hypothetical protein
VLTKTAVDTKPAPPRVVPGQGPVETCVTASGQLPPPAALAAACRTKMQATSPDALAHHDDCGSVQIDQTWKRIDDRHWEHTMKVEQQLNAGPQSAAVQAEMATVIAQLQQEARSASPEEADAARQQLAALRGAGIGAPAQSIQTTLVHERWTRIADTCTR